MLERIATAWEPSSPIASRRAIVGGVREIDAKKRKKTHAEST